MYLVLNFFCLYKVDNKRIHVQKRLVLCNLKELYEEYKNKFPNNKVGFSKFASLRPKNCILAGSSGTHSVCVCAIHQNLKLMLEGAFKKADNNFKDYHTWLSLGVCSVPTYECYYGNCSSCPGFEGVRLILRDYFDEMNIDVIQYNMWTTTDRSDLVLKSENADQFIDNFISRLPKLLQHSFVTKQQNLYFKHIKDNLQYDEFLVVLDFSENYTFTIQDEIQSYHWTKEQATIHPFGVYYRTDTNIEFTNCIIISDIKKHNSTTVNIFINNFVEFISQNIRKPKKIIYFSDGSAAQYKNKTNFYNISCHEMKFKIEAEWNFFPTSHGKNVSDGLGGSLKRLVTKACLQNSSLVINTPDAMYRWASTHIKNMNFVYVSKDEYDKESININKINNKLIPIPKTQTIHQIIPVDVGTLKAKYFSLSQEEHVHKLLK